VQLVLAVVEVVDASKYLLYKGRYYELWYQRNLIVMLLGVQSDQAHQRLEAAQVHVLEQEAHAAFLEESAVALQQKIAVHGLELL